MAAFLLPGLVLVIAALVFLDIRRSGAWDPWDEFGEDEQ